MDSEKVTAYRWCDCMDDDNVIVYGYVGYIRVDSFCHIYPDRNSVREFQIVI